LHDVRCWGRIEGRLSFFHYHALRTFCIRYLFVDKREAERWIPEWKALKEKSVGQMYIDNVVRDL
jgi:hypothetical protein